jgi:16S rRNA (adenine1518-N6/adenine1519-N6)-dimethyltransferase
MSLYQKTRHLIRDYEISPRKRFGQSFMVDEHFLRLMIAYAYLSPSDVVLEVGAGFGFLTRLLAQKSGRVVAVEVDARLVRALRSELEGFGNIELIEGDVLRTEVLPFGKVVSNPPFSISSPLLFWLLSKPFNCGVLTFQREFARRLNAPVGSRDYSRLTVATYYHSEVEVLDNVPRGAFYPQPDVDAAIVRLKPRKSPPFGVKDEKVFDEVVRTLFSQRNRKLRTAILPLLHKQGLTRAEASEKVALLPFYEKRVRELAPEDFGALANELSA